MSKKTINEILLEITSNGSIYDEIIDNILHPKVELKSELISEIAVSYLDNKEKIEKIWNEGYFKYYFINTVRNQVRSSTSSFYKNVKVKDNIVIEDTFDIEYEDSEDIIKLKEQFEDNYALINGMIQKLNITWFERQMFNEYYINSKTYRQIEEEYGLDHVLVWKTVTKVIKHLKNKIQ
jgi:RNA polymerase sigma factor (sigma-70 family)